MDPEYALAYAGLADAWTILVDYGAFATDQLVVAEEAARKAIELDPNLAEPYSTLALIRSIYWSWEQSEHLYQRSISLNPNYSTAHHWLGIDLMAPLGRFEEAMERLDIAQRLDPLSTIIPEGRAMLLMWWGRHAESIAFYEELMRRNPGVGKFAAGAGRAFSLAEDYPHALELLEIAAKTDPETPSRLGALGQVYAWAGRHREARNCLARLHQLAEQRHVPGTCFAVIHLGLGEIEEALGWLETAVRRNDAPVLSIGVHPAYDALRSEPRFQALLRQGGLEQAAERAEYYRKTAR
jgi:serine/threonine-protein kinase